MWGSLVSSLDGVKYELLKDVVCLSFVFVFVVVIDFVSVSLWYRS